MSPQVPLCPRGIAMKRSEGIVTKMHRELNILSSGFSVPSDKPLASTGMKNCVWLGLQQRDP